ncbi:MAG TPA: glycosyltransferase family A protein, partial [Thermodesulfobacteriota bacterium]|nr:glycosyltransferase family A protein [Thermodesulfobacteriota bacterium]
MSLKFILLFLIFIVWIREYVKNRKSSSHHFPSNLGLTDFINPPLVSVIIPARNEMENISTCLTSIIRQNYNELEIIVIDDGSKDGTYRAVEDMQKNNAKLKLIKNGNLPEGWIGKNYAIHLGMKEAGGEWLLFLDADT